MLLLRRRTTTLQRNLVVLTFYLVIAQINVSFAAQDILQTTDTSERICCVTDTLGKPIIGASIRLLSTNALVRTNNAGCFTLRIHSPSLRIRVSALGYASVEQSIPFSQRPDTLPIILKVLPIKMQTIDIVAGPSALDVIKHVVQKASLGTFTSASMNLYTKTRVQTTTSRQTLSQGKLSQDNASLVESWQIVHHKKGTEESSYHTLIQDIQFSPNTDPRIAAASMLPLQSLNTLDGEITFLTTTILSPLSYKGLAWYNYTLLPSKNDKIYHVGFHPRQYNAPGLVGMVTVRALDYTIVQIAYSTSPKTSIPYIDSLRVEQEYQEYVIDSLRQITTQIPISTQYGLYGNFKILPFFVGTFYLEGLATIDSIRFNNQTIAEYKNNETLDSVSTLLRSIPSGKTIALTRLRLLTFPQLTKNPVGTVITRSRRTPLTPDEILLYTHSPKWKPPALEQATSTLFVGGDANSLNWHNPYTIRELFPLNTIFTFRPAKEDTTWLLGVNVTGIRSRTTNIGIGAEIAAQWQRSITLRAGFIANATPILYNLGAEWTVARWNQGNISIAGSVFSKVKTIQSRRWDDEMFSPIFGLNIDCLAFSAWYDFFRETGYSLEARYLNGPLHLVFTAQQTHNEKMPTIATIDNDTRPNIAAQNGEFRFLKASLAWNYWQPSNIAIYTSLKPHCGVRLNATYGVETTQALPYYKIDASIHLLLPTFATDYAPMYGEAAISSGWASEQAPIQEYFFMQKRYWVNGHLADFFSVPTISFGGNQFFSVRAEHNFSDILWRMIGLPTYKGRGIEMIAHGGIARYTLSTHYSAYDDQQLFAPSSDWYTEVGFGIGRIPTVIFDVLSLRFDAAWGIGKQGTGKFGWSLSAQVSL